MDLHVRGVQLKIGYKRAIEVSIDDYNEVCQLCEAARLKLTEVRLSDEHISVSINTIKEQLVDGTQFMINMIQAGSGTEWS
ncbi:hypothetical protein JCGZ_03674 [Jatropha curcas]|uniref:Uncharacterized protein n=1 Tax=Jatropha curcas TaxID=180498 RepID=A0A067KTC1_JATCU|nr:hypothetical protein JCGZ_03674 [Jatropha curcas]